MSRSSRLVASIVLLVAALMTTAVSTASAAPAAGDPADTAAAAACPAPGERVRTSSSTRVFLIDPQRRLRWIPNETVYFSLWDSWAGIRTYNNLFVDCYRDWGELNNAHLAKIASAPYVFIWDSDYGYRWIINESVFNRYAFSWGKIRTQGSVGPISSLNWT
jgi:hypothetical protein